jgi:hypothetical protein
MHSHLTRLVQKLDWAYELYHCATKERDCAREQLGKFSDLNSGILDQLDLSPYYDRINQAQSDMDVNQEEFESIKDALRLAVLALSL